VRTCPNCHEKLPLFEVKNNFKCKNCQSDLTSNTTFAALVPLIVGGFVATSVSEMFFDKNIYVYGFDLLIVFLIFLLSWPILLKIKLKE